MSESDLLRVGRWQNIPAYLKENAKWAMATLSPLDALGIRRDKAPRSPINGMLLSTNSDDGWLTFDEVVRHAPSAIGFRLTANLGVVCIDGDKRKVVETNPDSVKFYKFPPVLFGEHSYYDGTYIERSQSGDGFHIIMYGPTGKNLNISGTPLELFRENRFVITTGDFIGDEALPIREGGKAYENFLELVSKHKEGVKEVRDTARPVPIEAIQVRDEIILQKMFSEGGFHEGSGLSRGAYLHKLYMTAPIERDPKNPTKPYDDWSVLDMQLAHAIVNYTRNPEQFLSIFRQSALYRGHNGKKPGYQNKLTYDRDYLIKFTFTNAALAWADRQTDDKSFMESIDKAVADNKARYFKNIEAGIIIRGNSDYLSPLPEIEFPPGLIGMIAEYVYADSIKPLREGALVAALSLMAAYTGRHYNIHRTGLGLYIILAAKTGRGKESATKGVLKLMSSVKKIIPASEIFLAGGALSSGAAGQRMLHHTPTDDSLALPSKLLISNEVGKLFQNMLKSEPSEHYVTLQKFLLDVYSKSDWLSEMAPMIYARNEDRVESIRAPNLTILGDMTSEMLPAVLTENAISSGFIPRWLCVEYRGPRQPTVKLSEKPNQFEPTEIIDRLVAIVQGVLRANAEGRVTNIQFQPAAEEAYYQFEEEINERIHEIEMGSTPFQSEILNRAGLMVLKLAGLVAVGCNHISPEVTLEHIEWAIKLVNRSCLTLSQYSNATKTRRSEARIEMVYKFMVRWFVMSDEEKRKRGALPKQIENKVLPRGIIVDNVITIADFHIRDDYEKTSSTERLFDEVFDALVKRGHIGLVERNHTREMEYVLNERGIREIVDNGEHAEITIDT